MLDIESIIRNESVEDVLLYFALRTSYPSIDRMYVKYKFEVISSRELMLTHQRLIEEGKLLKTGKPLPEKGPNWKEPEFVKQKKYGIE